MFKDALVADGLEDFSMEVIEAEDDESLTEKPDVKLGVERLSESDESVAEAGRSGLMSAG